MSSDHVEQTRSIDQRLVLGTKHDLSEEGGGGEEADHPSLQLELKLPCSERGNNIRYSGCERWPSSMTPASMKRDGSHWRNCEDGNDDDDGASGQRTRKKLRLTKEQSCYLEKSFKEKSTLKPKQKVSIAKKLNLQPRQVEVWFQNRRARTKLKQTEMDFEHLKQRCKSLAIENQNLERELEELKSLRVTLPRLHLWSPAATLALCPSCERAASSEMVGRNRSTTLHVHVKREPIEPPA